jgi:hypothetical protein
MTYPELDPLDPEDLVPYSIDFSDWLTSVGGDTIASVSWAVENCANHSSSFTTTVATILVDTGVEGTLGRATCQITTATGLKKSQTIQFVVRDQ